MAAIASHRAAAVELRFEGACASADASVFAGDVARVLAIELVPALRADIRIDAVASQADDAWRLSVETRARGERHRREMTAATCALARRAAVSIVALTLDRLLRTPPLREKIAEPAPAMRDAPVPIMLVREQLDARPPSEPMHRSIVRPPATIERARDAGSGLGAYLRGDVLVAAGVVPAPTAALAATAGVEFDPGLWRAEASFAFFLRQDATLDDHPAIGGRVGLISGGLRVCRSADALLPHLSFCTGGEAGLLTATPFGAESPKIAKHAWAALALGPSMALPLGPGTNLRFQAEGVIPLASGFAFESVEDGIITKRQLFEPWPVALRLSLGGEIFW